MGTRSKLGSPIDAVLGVRDTVGESLDCHVAVLVGFVDEYFQLLDLALYEPDPLVAVEERPFRGQVEGPGLEGVEPATPADEGGAEDVPVSSRGVGVDVLQRVEMNGGVEVCDVVREVGVVADLVSDRGHYL